MKRPIAFLTASATALFSVSPGFAGGGGSIACYEPVHSPATYATVSQDVLVQPAEIVYDVVPATYGYQDRTVLVQPERVVSHTIPATYRTVAKRVLIRPEQTIHRATPPVYKTVAETVIVAPAGERWEWRVINGHRVYCRVHVPARHATRHRTVLVHPGKSYAQVIPAEYGTEYVNVVVTPSQVEKSIVPAEYRTVREKVVLEPQRKIARHIAARYEARHRQVKTSEGRDGWQQVHLRGSGC